MVAAILIAIQSSPASPTPVPGHVEETYPEIPRVSLDDTRVVLDAGTATFVDVRSVEAFQSSHIRGAINIPLNELEARLGELDKAKWIITYCT